VFSRGTGSRVSSYELKLKTKTENLVYFSIRGSMSSLLFSIRGGIGLMPNVLSSPVCDMRSHGVARKGVDRCLVDYLVS
jgi:hypothetical protein